MSFPQSELQLDTVLAWAVEVEPAQLISSLLTYKKLLSTLLTLRTCNRFGRGAEAHINKLPVELINLIESKLMQVEGRWTLAHWRESAKCAAFVDEDIYQLETVKHFLNHLDEDHRCDVGMDWSGACAKCCDLVYSQDFCKRCKYFDDHGIEKAIENKAYRKAFVQWFVEEGLDENEWHDVFKQEWLAKAKTHSLIDDDCRKLLKTCFGLDSWSSTIRQAEKSEDGTLSKKNKTMMHLILPHCLTREQAAAETFEITESESWSVSTQQCLHLTTLPVLDEATQMRFGRALNALQLDQIHGAALRECVKENAVVEPCSRQTGPSLLLLCRAEVATEL